MQDFTETSIQDKIFCNNILTSYVPLGHINHLFSSQAILQFHFTDQFQHVQSISMVLFTWKALLTLLPANQVIRIFQDPLYRPTFILEDLHCISFYWYHYSAKHTAWSTELWHSSQINKQKPSFPDSWYLGVSKELIFPTLDLVINLVLLLCLSLLSQMTVCPWIHQDMKICMFTWHFPGIFTYNLCLKCSRMEFHILLVSFIIPFFNLKLVCIKD